MGLYGTKSKKGEVEKVLAFTHKDLVKKANEVYIDFKSFKQAKANLLEHHTVKSTLRENCVKRKMPKSLINEIAPDEISMHAIKSAVYRNASIRKSM